MTDVPAAERDSGDVGVVVDEVLSPAALKEAERYGRLELWAGLADKALDVGYLAVVAFWVVGPIDRWLAATSMLSASRYLLLATLFVVVTALHAAISFPLSWYRGYVLEHQFGLSTQTPRAWLWRYTKRMGLALAFGLLMVLAIYALIWNVGRYWWLASAGAFFLVSVVLGQLAPVLILPLFYKIQRLDSPELAERMRRLSQGTGLTVEGVYRMDLSAETVKANAMLAGLGGTRRVLLGDTLLGKFSSEEIEVIFAHEIGHHVHRHIPKLMVIGAVLSLAGFAACDAVLRAYAGLADVRLAPVWTLPLVLLSITVFSLLSEPVQNAISRIFERQSDWYALERTAAPNVYRSAFRKLARLNKDDPNPPWLEVLLFHSHPPIGQRLAMADRYAAQCAP